jgi:hypothetical protein
MGSPLSPILHSSHCPALLEMVLQAGTEPGLSFFSFFGCYFEFPWKVRKEKLIF